MRRCWLLAALCAAAFMVTTVSKPQTVSAQDNTVVVSVDGLIFEEPDDRSRVILRVQAGQKFEAIGQQGNWIKVQLPRGTGWILSKLVVSQNDSPPLAGIGDKSAERVTIVDEYADVKAGPGAAYLGVKRVFRGDSFSVAQRSEDGEWVQIRIDGDLGWVRADQIMAAEAVVDPGNGGAMAGGGGNNNAGGGGNGGNGNNGDNGFKKPDTGVGTGIETPDDGQGGGMSLEVRVGGNFQLVTQDFNSNSPSNPFLQLYTVDTALAGPSIEARAWFADYVGVGVDYQLGIGSPIQVPLQIGQPPVELSNQTHRLNLDLTGRFPITDGARPTWVGLTVGGALHQFDIQTVQQDATQPPVFLVNTYLGLRVLLEANVSLGPVDVFGGGGLVLGSLDQGQFDSGTANGTTYFTAGGGLSFNFGDFGLYVEGNFDSYTTDFQGAATRQNDIDLARNKDVFLSFSSGLLWRPL